MRTGVFYFHMNSRRLRNFPSALHGILEKDNIAYYDAVYESAHGQVIEPVPEDLILRVHDSDYIKRIKKDKNYPGAIYSAGGTLLAAKEILAGNIDNAFVFTSTGDHHAGRDFGYGGCYMNGAAIAIEYLRDNGMQRFAIIDTDLHHGDGTRDLFIDNPDVLHICFCNQDHSDEDNNVDINIPFGISDEEYLKKAEAVFSFHLTKFNPEMIFWEFGYDATYDDYGDKGISPDFHAEFARKLKEYANSNCHDKMVTILCGGSRSDYAEYIIPRVINVLSE